MFRRLDDTAPDSIVFVLDGETVSVPAGITLAAALLLQDAVPFRLSPIGGRPRAPLCLMGACFECLVEIDGLAGQRACQVQVRAGMRVARRLRPASAGTGH